MKAIFLVWSIMMVLLSPTVFGQAFAKWEVPFREDGDPLKLALAGGLNNPQWSEVDLNNDGIMDLFIFDREGDVSLCFINDGVTGEPSYTFAPEYAAAFPKLNKWALLRDFNADGAMDIFSYSTIPGVFAIEVYKGRFENDQLQFSKMSFSEGELDIIYYKQSNGSFTNLYVTNIDIPAIGDVDMDGDLDVLTFSLAGGYLEFFRNYSVERGFGLDSLKFELEDNCWGKFFESGDTPALTLSDEMGICATPFREPVRRHVGSTVMMFDEDGDGDVEVVLGDISFTNLVKATNGGSAQSAFITAQDAAFPSYNFSVDIPIFPVGFYLDLNNDGKQDMIASPNTRNGLNYNVGWWYKNVSTTDQVTLELQQEDFFTSEMIDVGSGAHPAFVDYNADGLMDLVVGSGGFFLPGGERDSRLFLYENKGTKTEPSFDLVDDNYLNFKDFADDFGTFAPCFGDLDDDGDNDLLVGEINGSLFFVENEASAGQPLQFGTIQQNYMNLDVGQVSKPQIIDLNNDGLNDLVIGERNGNLNYFQNIGSVGSPQFDPILSNAPNTAALGQVDTRSPNTVTGFSSPLIFKKGDDFQLLAGTENGVLERYTNIANNINGTFDLSDETWGEIRVGARTHPALADLDDDGIFEMLVGNNRGGLNGFKTNMTTEGTVPVRDVFHESVIKIYPNPAKDFVQIEVEMKIDELKVYNTLGQVIWRISRPNNKISIPTSSWPKGVYFIAGQVDGQSQLQKFIVQ